MNFIHEPHKHALFLNIIKEQQPPEEQSYKNTSPFSIKKGKKESKASCDQSSSQPHQDRHLH